MAGRISPWLLALLLGGLALPGVGQAQRSSDNELTLELLQRVEELEEEVRQIRGELEVYRYRVESIEQARSTTGYPPAAPTTPPPASGQAVTDEQPSAHGQTPPEPAQAPAAVSPPAAAPTPPAAVERAPAAPPTRPTAGGTEQADFDAALGKLREGNYQEATTGFQHFLSAYPASNLAGDAQYWLGESCYVSHDYNGAKEAFINLGLHYPQSARLPDALLKLGYIYGELGDIARAQEVLQKLVQVYPNTQAANLAERRLQSLR